MADPGNSPPANGWSKYEALVLDKLDSLSRDHREMRVDVAQMGKDLSALKVKAGIWGGVAGIIPAVGVLLWHLVTGAKGK